MEKNSAVKFSPLGTTGEIGEILPLAKISRYTVLLMNYEEITSCPYQYIKSFPLVVSYLSLSHRFLDTY